MPPGILMVAFSFSRGGAAIAARSLVRAVDGLLPVVCYPAERSRGGDLPIHNPGRLDSALHFVQRLVSYGLVRLMRDGNPVKHSLNLFSARHVERAIRRYSRMGYLVHVHWINNDALSLWALGRLPEGSIVTLQDEWLYCGAEHYYPVGATDHEFADGYPTRDRVVRGLNWNRWAWKAKLHQLSPRDDLTFTVPSRWLLGRAQESRILRGKNVRLLPNPIDTELFRPLEPLERQHRRKAAGIADDDIVVAFGAVRGEKNPLKGMDILRDALVRLRSADGETTERIRLVTFGAGKPGREPLFGYRAVRMGKVSDPEVMRTIFAMADVTVVPSLVESFGQVAAESLACGAPVVAFRTSGLTDIVEDGVSGFFAEPFEAESLMECLLRMIRLPPSERSVFGRRGRAHVVDRFSYPVVRQLYHAMLRERIAP